MRDNDMQFFNYIYKLIDKIDDNSEVQIHSSLSGYKIIIRCTDSLAKKMLQRELLEANVIIGNLMEFSKTIDYSDNITFFIKTN